MALLLTWGAIRSGASNSPSHPFAQPARGLVATSDQFDLDKRRREHWAWQPVRAQAPPTVDNTEWPRDAIDSFVLAPLEARGLSPANAAERRVLIRRLYFDLIGLPPSSDEVESFVEDNAVDSLERLVDRLLGSPHFGERWGRHWLDLVRYAETRGHEFDHIIPNAYQYRDYVIRALNADLPYDQFVTEQVAGDLMDQPRLHPADQSNESLLGTGFWFLGEELHSPVDIRGDEIDRLDNKIDVYSKAFLGLTVSCARCHDHKFDAISMRDYYGLAGFLLSSSYRQAPFQSLDHNRKLVEEVAALEEEFRPRIVREVAASFSPGIARISSYLVAAENAIRSQTRLKSLDPLAIEAEVGSKSGLDSALLHRWVAEIKRAQNDINNPLHLWALVACAAADDASDRSQATLSQLMDQCTKTAAQVADSSHAARTVIDLSNPAVDDWSQDGVVVGLRLKRPGDIRFSSDPARPIAELFQVAAAQSDSRWDVQVEPNTERDPGKVAWLQSGRTLRTRTFTLTTGKLYYLVRGAGHAYAAVDSHRLIVGPLHGSLTKSWESDSGDNLRWIEHDLSTYQGHRVHIEFSPIERDPKQSSRFNELSLLGVVESDTAPSIPLMPQVSLCQMLSGYGADSATALAHGYETVCTQAMQLFGSERIVGSSHAETMAWVASWLIQHPELIGADDLSIAAKTACAAAPLIESVAAIEGKMRRVSQTAPAILDGNGVDEYVLSRGNHRTPGALVPRRFLQAIPSVADGDAIDRSKASTSNCVESNALVAMFDRSRESDTAHGSGRSSLAAAMTDPSNPLLARVLVNRLWHHLFGRGIVPSVDNFGVLGQPPTHPALLDYLASDFVANGWSIKRMIRRMVLSSTYRMSSLSQPETDLLDPENALYHHMPVRRLEGEVIRDSILAVSGRLDTAMFGPSVELNLTPFMEGRGRPPVSGPLDGAGRRSVYLKVRRNFLHPMLIAFDAPTPFTTIGRRAVSNVPAQALSLMNNGFVVAEAKRWAQQTIAQCEMPADRVQRMFLEAYSRPCTAAELQDILQFILDQQKLYAATTNNDPRPWQDLAHILLNAKEFIFIQ